VERLDKLVPGSVKDLTVGTFHSICAKILRIDGKAIGIQPEFVIYDGDDQTAIVKRCFAELNLDPKQHPPQAVISAISKAKSKMISPADFAKHSRSYFEEVIGRVYERYEKNLIESKRWTSTTCWESSASLPQKSGNPGPLPGTLHPRDGGRISGHQHGAVRTD